MAPIDRLIIRPRTLQQRVAGGRRALVDVANRQPSTREAMAQRDTSRLKRSF